MRILFVSFAAFLAAGMALPAWAGEADAPPAASPPPAITPPPVAPTRQGRLDQLFADLKRERNEKAAERIAGRIWSEWNQSGSASIDLMMQWAQKATEDQKFDVALDFLDQVVTLQPDYAEGWNRRATVHFMMKNYGKSMADIDRTLQLEPRHFGALSGLAQIMAETGHKQSALEAWQKVLTIYPMMRSAQDQVSTLSEELAGEGI
jgi:tetratricopeptide (TPR) repeat protein